VKNKMAPPFKSAEIDIIYGHGISREGDVLDLGVAQTVLEKSGSWLSYGETRLGQGREAARQLLKDNPDLCREIELKIRRKLGLIRDEAKPAAPADAAVAKGEGRDDDKTRRAPAAPERPTRPPSARI